MPDMDGLELIIAIQGLNSSAKIIAMSGDSSLTHSLVLQMSEMLGAERVLTKPFPPQDLVDLVKEQLEGR